MTKNWLWVDTETTGLDPTMGMILEVGLIVTTTELDEIARTSVVIHRDSKHVNRFLDHDWTGEVRSMHQNSGLLSQVEASTIGPDAAEKYLIDWIDSVERSTVGEQDDRTGEAVEREVGRVRGGPMCGSTVAFDRAWLEAWMPGLAACWHYRNVDVSGLRTVAREWCAPAVIDGLPHWRGMHRVLPDLEDSITLARYLRRTMGKGDGA